MIGLGLGFCQLLPWEGHGEHAPHTPPHPDPGHCQTLSVLPGSPVYLQVTYWWEGSQRKHNKRHVHKGHVVVPSKET